MANTTKPRRRARKQYVVAWATSFAVAVAAVIYGHIIGDPQSTMLVVATTCGMTIGVGVCITLDMFTD